MFDLIKLQLFIILINRIGRHDIAVTHHFLYVIIDVGKALMHVHKHVLIKYAIFLHHGTRPTSLDIKLTTKLSALHTL